MTDLEQNYQAIYFHPHNSKGCAMNLMAFGFHQFQRVEKIKRLGEYKELCFANEKASIDDRIASEFGFNQLLDCIKISLCFENFMKSLLLLNGYIIHKLEKNSFKDLYYQQFNRPIALQEILSTNKWEINEKLQTTNPEMRNQIKGILKNTIGMKELLSKEYQKLFNISPNIISVCKPYFEYRNNLHLYMHESINISINDYRDLIEIISFVNNHLVRIHNLVIDDIGKSSEYKLHKIQLCV
ncbi:MAG: hypothetical protein IPM95_05245 [Sphingobacteriales bacterium]|jgi:hypothetical protein|nr:hypothetical protein [Sphingobacteriales bacterium]